MFKNDFLAIFLFFTIEFVNYFYEFNMIPHERGYYIERENLFFIINLLLKITDISRVLNYSIIGEPLKNLLKVISGIGYTNVYLHFVCVFFFLIIIDRSSFLRIVNSPETVAL